MMERGHDQPGKRLHSTSVPTIILVQPVGGDKLSRFGAFTGRKIHQVASGEKIDARFRGNFRERSFQNDMLDSRLYPRGALVVHQDHVNSRSEQPIHTLPDKPMEHRRLVMTHCTIRAYLPNR